MSKTIAEVMTDVPETIEATDTLRTAAERMRDCDCGTLLVTGGGRVVGIVTDRDLVVRGLATGADLSTPVENLVSTNVHGVSAKASIAEAVAIMRANSIRRLPVVDEGALVGIVSIGDLAVAQDEDSALAQISSAPANR